MLVFSKLLKKVPSILVLNKRDLIKENHKKVVSYFRSLGQSECCLISASSGENLEELEEKIISLFLSNDEEKMTEKNKRF